jgi:hypothetical protein
VTGNKRLEVDSDDRNSSQGHMKKEEEILSGGRDCRSWMNGRDMIGSHYFLDCGLHFSLSGKGKGRGSSVWGRVLS